MVNLGALNFPLTKGIIIFPRLTWIYIFMEVIHSSLVKHAVVQISKVNARQLARPLQRNLIAFFDS